MKTYHVDLDKIRARYDKPGIKYVAMSGVKADLIEERHVIIRMPLGDTHINHVGTAYAGSIFVEIELAAAALFFSTYGVEEWVPIVRHVSIDYLNPAKTDLVAELSISEEDATAKIEKIEVKGRGSYIIMVSLKDTEGKEVTRAEVVLYVIPFTQNSRSKRGCKNAEQV